MPSDEAGGLSPGSPDPSADPPAPALTDDRFLGGRLAVLQPAKGYRASIDAVFLAAAIPCRPGETVFEAGLGTGVAALCVLAREPEARITGVEVAGPYAELAETNAKRNGMADRLHVLRVDIKDALPVVQNSFAHAYANPPFFERGKVQAPPDRLKAAANAHTAEELDLWVKALARAVAPKGTVTLVQRADVVGRLLEAMEGRLGDIRIAPLFPRHGAPASRVIVQGVKGSRAPLQLLPGLVLHGAGSTFTPEAEAVLRHAAAWPLR
jgi:tRNA1(Val) A37 N6-methylase TrmN6